MRTITHETADDYGDRIKVGIEGVEPDEILVIDAFEKSSHAALVFGGGGNLDDLRAIGYAIVEFCDRKERETT